MGARFNTDPLLAAHFALFPEAGFPPLPDATEPEGVDPYGPKDFLLTGFPAPGEEPASVIQWTDELAAEHEEQMRLCLENYPDHRGSEHHGPHSISPEEIARMEEEARIWQMLQNDGPQGRGDW